MREKLNTRQCMGDKEGELYQSVKLASLDLVGSNPTSYTIKKITNQKGDLNVK